jgi:hypothetical protein
VFEVGHCPAATAAAVPVPAAAALVLELLVGAPVNLSGSCG